MEKKNSKAVDVLEDKVEQSFEVAEKILPEHLRQGFRNLEGNTINMLGKSIERCNLKDVFQLSKELGENSRITEEVIEALKKQKSLTDKEVVRINNAFSNLDNAVADWVIEALVDQCGCRSK